MHFQSPETLGVTLVVGSDTQDDAFALCHPSSDGPPDMQISVIFRISPPAAEVLRIFHAEVVSIVARDGTLYCVDRLQHMYAYAAESWTDFNNPDLRPYRINDLRVVRGQVYGVGNDRMIFLWQSDHWVPITSENKDLYLYDIADWHRNGFVISGEQGYLATLRGGELNERRFPTNVDLTCVLPLSEDSLLVTGWDATAIVFDDGAPRLIDSGGRELNFLNAVRWNGHVLIAAESEILELRGDALDIFAKVPATLLSAPGRRLWRQGLDGIAYLDVGTDWAAVPVAVDLSPP